MKDSENKRLMEELNLYKGRLQNMQRDIQMSSQAMDKLNNDQGSMGEEICHYRGRIQELEGDLQQVHQQKTDQHFEIRTLTTEKERLEHKIK